MNNQTTKLCKNEFKKTPFIDIILPYTQSFIEKLEEKDPSVELVNKLHVALLQEMSSIAEVALQKELDNFKSNGQNCYEEFIKITSLLLSSKYPVLDKILKTIAKNYSKHIQNIYSNFSNDFHILKESFSITGNKDLIIEDMDTSLGDGHSGESTALITLSNGLKIIYKPRNIDTANSYNLFIKWVNHKLDTNLKTIKSVSRENYGWLEFTSYEAVNTANEIREYYHKAGILLAVTLLLGSKDCHFENIIASGKDPIIIDYETIIQPVLSNQSIRTWDEQHKIPPFSVLESMLIVNRGTGAPLECAGYGIKENIETLDIESKVINPNTIDSKRNTYIISKKLVKENIPFYKDNYMFADNYKSFLIEGFSIAYNMFINSRKELLSSNSPLLLFEHQKIRYVWRPTFVYFRILKYMRNPSFMSSFEAYESKLYEIMAKAYQKDNSSNYKFILEHEMNQMLKGDIPLFNLDSLDCHLGENESFKIFTSNSIKNIKFRINLLSTHHKKKQIEYITEWLNLNILN